MRLLCSAIDFGFGSAGKLDAILQHLPEAEVTFMDSEFGSLIGLDSVSQTLSHIDTVDGFDAALVVLNPGLADDLTQRGIDVVYVDSLPHLWGANDFVCTEVTAYCAQRVGDLNLRSVEALAEVRHLVEVEAIIPDTSPTRRLNGRALVNIGGVHSPFAGRTSRYASLVVPPMVEMLLNAGYNVRVLGNVDDSTRAALPAEVESGPVPHARMVELLSSSSVLFTSPGMTTLLEAGAAGIPTVLLPPQNVSQVLNADRVTGTTAAHPSRVDWAHDVLDLDQVRLLSRRSELEALEYVYARIESAPSSGRLAEDAVARISAGAGWLTRYTDRVGANGAAQVADVVREVARRGRAL